MTTKDSSADATNCSARDGRDWNAIEPERSALRVLVASVELELGKLREPPHTERATALAALTSSWTKLVAELALGPEPLLRTCPSCGLSIRRAATRCRYCLKPSAAADGASPAATRG